MRIKKVDSKSIILHENTEVKLKQREIREKFSFLQGLTEGVRYRIFLRTNTLIEKLKRERNLRTDTSFPKVSERVSTKELLGKVQLFQSGRKLARIIIRIKSPS